jgi:hypothetical protein
MISTASLHARVLGYAASPFPVSFDGNGVLYAAALFVLIVITSLATMVGIAHAQRLWADRAQGKTLAWAFRTLITAVCAASIIRCSPEVVYMIAYADASAETLQSILVIKRSLDVFAIVPVLLWMSIVWLYGPEIEFAMKYPAGKMWTDHRLHRLRRFASIVGLAGALAVTVTLGRLFG